MLLILFRHGIAEPGGEGLPDAERALTPRGIERTMAAVRGLARLIDRPQVILTSPKTRAMQTAAILGDALDLVPQRLDALAAEMPQPILLALRSRTESSLLLVGHEPSMSRLIGTLCGAPDAQMELKKAGAAMVEASLRRDEGSGPAVLHWLLPPRALRMLASSA